MLGFIIYLLFHLQYLGTAGAIPKFIIPRKPAKFELQIPLLEQLLCQQCYCD